MVTQERYWPARAYWLCQIGGWGGWAFVNSILSFWFQPSQVSKTVVTAFALSIAGMASSHVLRWWIRRQGWIHIEPLKAVPRLVAASIVCGIVNTNAMVVLTLFVMRYYQPHELKASVYVANVAFWSTVILFWSVIYFGLHYFEKSRRAGLEKLRLELMARDSQLRSLRAQVNPHFIFNCLNSIRALILEDPARAQAAVTELSALLRYSLQSGRSMLVPLRDEVAVVEDYLRLEKIRFEQRLDYEVEIPAGLLNRQIPPMLLQTLVENGIKHGIAHMPRGGKLRIEGASGSGGFTLRVINSGVLQPNGVSGGVGLENARERLRLLCGPEAYLELKPLDGAQVLAEVFIP